MAIAAENLSRMDFSDVADGDLEPVPPGEVDELFKSDASWRGRLG